MPIERLQKRPLDRLQRICFCITNICIGYSMESTDSSKPVYIDGRKLWREPWDTCQGGLRVMLLCIKDFVTKDKQLD